MSFPDRHLDRSTVERSLRAVVPEWDLRDAALAESGHAAVYRCRVGTPDTGGTRDVYLKATPTDEPLGVDLEARLLALLDGTTGIPVPRLLGAVDDANGLPTPLHVTAAVPGGTVPRPELGTLDRETVERVARTLGEALAELHSLDAPGGYGYLRADGPDPRGGRPPADLDAFDIVDSTDDWQETVSTWADGTLDELGGTRFADVVDRVRPVVDARLADLTGDYRPVLCHVDGAVENVVLDGDEPVALLDWAFTIAATPAWDLVCVERSLAGSHWSFVPDAPDIRETVRDGLFDGYRPNAPAGAIEEYEADGDLYHLLSLLRTMKLHDDWFALRNLDGALADAAAAAEREALVGFL